MTTIQLDTWEILVQELELSNLLVDGFGFIGRFTPTKYMWCTLHGRFFDRKYRSCLCDSFEYVVRLSVSEIVDLLLEEIETGAREVETHKWRK